MKKLIYPMFALAALAMTNTSCSDEIENGAVTNSNEVAVSFKLQLENEVDSRTVGDGKTAKELHFAAYKAGKDANGKPYMGTEIEYFRKSPEKQNTITMGDDLKAEIKLTLVKGQTYNFLFWAQCEGGNKYYNVDYETGIVTVNYKDDATTTTEDEGRANNEERDAFFKVVKDLKVDGPIEQTIVLKRPFAQINVGTEVGSLQDAKNAEVWIKNSSFIIKDAATKLNTYSGAATDKQMVAYSPSQIIESMANLKDGVGDLKDVEQKNYEYLAMNYILVGDEVGDANNNIPPGESKQLINATFEIWGSQTDGGTLESINVFEIPNVPVRRNYRTNIIGDILNETVTFNIVIDNKFKDDINYFTEKELAYAFANGGEVTLPGGEITLTTPLILDDPNNFVTINLNGTTIKSPKFAENNGVISEGNTDSYPFFVKAGTLNIKGEGKVQAEACTYSMAVFAAGGTVNIYGGEYSNAGTGSDLIYAKFDGATVNIYGGTFKACQKQPGTPGTQEEYSALNIRDEYVGTASINVYGGKFYKFNPANNKSEGEGTNFVADGYAVKQNGDYFEVVENAEIFAAGTDVEMVSDMAADETIVLAAGQELDGQFNTIEMVKSDAQYGIQSAGGTIKNLIIEGYNTRNEQAKVTRAIFIVKPTEDVVIENVKISGVAYPLNTGTTATVTGLTLTVKNSTLVGWSSWDGGFASASFTHCNFGVGSYFDAATIAENPGWNGCAKPYVTTTFKDCTFDDGMKLDVSALKAGATLTFTNCKVGNVLLTAANIESLLGAAYDGTIMSF